MFVEYTPQYLEMNAPVRHLDPHFDVLGFPCNQFGLQEPGLNHEILNGLRYVRPGGGFVPEFTMAAKVDVNGPNEHRLYAFMKVRFIFYKLISLPVKALKRHSR